MNKWYLGNPEIRSYLSQAVINPIRMKGGELKNRKENKFKYIIRGGLT